MNSYKLLLVSLLLASCQMQYDDHSSQKEPLVEFRPISTITLKKGARHELPLIFEIEEGYHIMADTGAGDRWVYTQMTLESEQVFLTDTPLFPPPEDLYLTDDTDPLSVFDEELEITLPILPAVQAESGAYQLRGQLLYQACTDKQCFFPRALDFQVPLQLGDSP